MRRLDLRQVLGEVDGEQLDAERAEAVEDALPWLRLLGAVLDGAPGRWVAEAPCRGRTGLMFPTRGEPVAPGLALCASCPVLDQCAAWAATVPGRQGGIIAGTTERKRRNLRAPEAA